MQELAAIFYPKQWRLWHLHGTMDEMFRMQVLSDGVRLVPGQAIIVDAGANIGLVTSAFAPAVKHIYAIEAFPDYYAILEKNREYNGWQNVSTFNFAVAAEDGVAQLSIDYSNPFAHSIAHDFGSGAISVPSVSLSSFIKDQHIKHIDLLKLDIEGAEHEVIAAPNFAEVAAITDQVFVETHYEKGDSIVDRLRGYGFREVKRPIVPAAMRLFTKFQ